MKFQSIPIDSYFLHFSDVTLDEAQLIKEKGSLHLLKRDKRKGYWLFEIREEEQIEVEVLIGKTKIKSCSCDCNTFIVKGVCHHIVAAIKVVLDSKEGERPPVRSFRTPRSLHTKTILQGISEPALRNFVVHYASQNPHFALMLKAKFAHNIEIENNLSKYFGLCKRFASTLGQGSLSALKLKKLVRYVDDLLDLADDLMSVGNFRETYHLVYGVLRFLNLRYVMYDETVLKPALHKSHEKLRKLLLSDVAPQLRKKILDNFFDVVANERYVVLDNLNLYSIMTRFSLKESDTNRVIDHLKEYVEEASNNDEAIFSLAQMYVQFDRSDELVDLICSHRENYSFVERSLLWIVEKENTKPIIFRLSDKLYSLADGQRLKNLSFRFLIGILENINERVNLCVDYFLSDRRLESYQRIKRILGPDFAPAYNQIIMLLEEKRDFFTLSMCLGEEGEINRLLQVIDSEREIDLLLSNLAYLYNDFYPETERLLLELIRDFLNIHVGQHAFNYTHQIIRQLRRGQFAKLVSAVVKMIADDFAERTFLMKSLDN